jgi:hypothetical protein
MTSTFFSFLRNPTDPYLSYAFSGLSAKNLDKLTDPKFAKKYTEALSYKALGIPPGKSKEAFDLVNDPDLKGILKDGKIDVLEVSQITGLGDLLALSKISSSLPKEVQKELGKVVETKKLENTSVQLAKLPYVPENVISTGNYAQAVAILPKLQALATSPYVNTAEIQKILEGIQDVIAVEDSKRAKEAKDREKAKKATSEEAARREEEAKEIAATSQRLPTMNTNKKSQWDY